MGPVSDEQLAVEYSRASIFVLPSYLEGFCIARVEAMAFGLPVITTETGVRRWLGASASSSSLMM